MIIDALAHSYIARLHSLNAPRIWSIVLAQFGSCDAEIVVSSHQSKTVLTASRVNQWQFDKIGDSVFLPMVSPWLGAHLVSVSLFIFAASSRSGDSSPV